MSAEPAVLAAHPAGFSLPGEEKRAAAWCFAMVLPFTLLVLTSGLVSVVEFVALLGMFVGLAVMLIATAVVLFAGFQLLQSGRRSRFEERPGQALLAAFSARWHQDRLFSLAWPIALFLLLLPSFNAFKQRILPHAGFHLDPQLAELDRMLFGTDPGILLHQWIGSPATTAFLDAIYHSWFLPTTLGLCVVGLLATPRTRAQYMISYVGVWLLLGAVCAWLLPAAGPAFYAELVDPAGATPFLAIHQQLAEGAQVRFLTSLANQQYLLTHLGGDRLVVGGGISALPSVHNGMAVLFALAAFRINRTTGVAMSLFAFLVWVASVYLNWHYAVDGIAGAAGAVIIWWSAGALVDRYIVAPSQPASKAWAAEA